MIVIMVGIINHDRKSGSRMAVNRRKSALMAIMIIIQA